MAAHRTVDRHAFKILRDVGVPTHKIAEALKARPKYLSHLARKEGLKVGPQKPHKVPQIYAKWLYQHGVPVPRIARTFKVTRPAIYALAKRHGWKRKKTK